MKQGGGRVRDKLVQLRKDHGMTQQDVATALGISRSFYGLIEQGLRNPPLPLARKIADLFNKTVDEIFFADACNNMKQESAAKAGD